MSTIFTFVQVNGWMIYAGGLGLGMLVIFIVQVCLLRRVGRIQRKLDAITEKVGNYLAVLMEPDPQTGTAAAGGAVPASQDRAQKEEEQNRIISSMLQEIFP